MGPVLEEKTPAFPPWASQVLSLWASFSEQGMLLLLLLLMMMMMMTGDMVQRER
jgi:hypothetical protein